MAISKETNDNALASTGEKGTFAHYWWERKTNPAFLKHFLHIHFLRIQCCFIEHDAGSYFISAQ